MADSKKPRPAALRFLASGWGVSALLLVLSLAYYLSFYRHGLIPNDEGHLLHFSERLYEGEVPGRDFYLETYIFGRYALLSFLFWLFGGPNLLIERMMWVILRAVCVVMHYSLGRRIMPKPYALVVSIFLMIVPGPWHKTPYTICSLLGLLTIFWFIEKKSLLRLAMCGLVTGLCLQFRQDIGLLVLGVTGLTLFLASGKGNSSENSGRMDGLKSRAARAAGWIGLYLIYITVTVAPAAFILWANGSLGHVLEQCFVEKFEQHMGLFNFVFRLGKMWEAGDQVGCFYFLIPPIVYLAAAILLAKWFFSRQRGDEILKLFAVFLVAFLSINQAYNHTLVIRLLQCAPPTYLLAAFMIWRAAVGIQHVTDKSLKKTRAWVDVGIPLILGVLLLACAIEIMTSDRESNLGVEYRGTIATYSSKNIPIESPRAEGILVAPPKAKLINQTVAYLQQVTRPEDPIFVASNDAIYYFLAARRNPSRFGKFFMPGELEERALLVTGQLEKNPVDFVVSTSRLLKERRSHPAIQYLNLNYVIDKVIDTRYQKTQVILKRR